MGEDAPDPVSQPQRTNPLGMIVNAIGSLGRGVVPGVIALYSFREELTSLGLAFAVAALIALVSGFIAFLRRSRLTYTVNTEDIRVESGLISRAARSVPYERIQDVSLEQGFLARLLGLVAVRFETGAGGKDELSLRFLSQTEADRLRELVRERRDDAPGAPSSPEAAAAEPAAEATGQVIFAMGPRRLVTFGLFEFSLAAIAVIGGLTQQFEFLLPFDIWEWEEWAGLLAGPGERIASFGPLARAAGIVLAVGSLLVLGVATGLVRTFLRDWGFTLERTAKGFRRRRGLLTRTDVVMPVHRVQALVTGTRIIRRRFGWHSLKLVSLAQDSGSASHVVAPFAKMAELVPIMQAAGFAKAPDTLEWRRASDRYRFDTAFIMLVIPLLAALAAIVFAPRLWFALIPLAIGVLFALREYFLWRYERHGLDASQIYRRSGWLAPSETIASRVKLHSVEVAQGPIARQRGYASLHLGLAGGGLSIPGLPLERARDLREAILASMTATDFSRLPA